LDGSHGEIGIVVATADDLATEHPDVVAVAGERLVGESVVQEIDQEGLDLRCSLRAGS